MQKGTAAFCGMFIGLVLLIVAFLGPWYTMSGSGALGMNYNVGLYLTRMEARGTITGQELSMSVAYADAQQGAQTAGVNTDSFAVINTAMFLTILAIVTAIIAVIGMLAFVMSKSQKTMKWVGGGFGILTFIFTLVPALYFMSTGFAQNNNGFWFSETVLGMTVSGGPGYSWYLMVVVAIIAVIAGVTILMKKVGPESAASS
jgi:hypothetical protein